MGNWYIFIKFSCLNKFDCFDWDIAIAIMRVKSFPEGEG
jgi:hypothetical protein